MGKLVKIDPITALPTQPVLNRERFSRALIEFKERGADRLSPCLCKESKDQYLVCDGHSRITIAFLTRNLIHTYVPNDRNDSMNPLDFSEIHSDGLRDMNYHLEERYHHLSRGLLITRRDYQIRSFEDLIDKNLELINGVWQEITGEYLPASKLP